MGCFGAPVWGEEPMTHRLLLGVNFWSIWIFLGIIEGPRDFFWF